MKNVKSAGWYALLAVVVVAVVVGPALFYWHSIRPWQHVVNLDDFSQGRIVGAPLHDRDPNNNLAEIPAGHQIMDGVRFNVADLIVLASAQDAAKAYNPYPVSVEGIPVNRLFREVHLIHGTTGSADEQALVAKLVLHYVDGSTADLDIVYGEQVYDWWFKGQGTSQLSLAGNTKVAWMGENKAARRKGYKIRVFETSFPNPKPSVRVETINYVSALAPTSAPFLVAMTAE